VCVSITFFRVLVDALQSTPYFFNFSILKIYSLPDDVQLFIKMHNVMSVMFLQCSGNHLHIS